MGTRGVIGFRIEDEDKVTYNHWDSYPTSLGMKMVNTGRTFDAEQLAGAAQRIELVDGNESAPRDLQSKYVKFLDNGVSTGQPEEWYSLLRDTQGSLEPYIKGELDHMIDSQGFLLDSLFCEWAYIFNLDALTFEVYKGFNVDPHAPGRYAALTSDDNAKYYGVSLIDAVNLKDLIKLSENEVEKLLNTWENTGEEE